MLPDARLVRLAAAASAHAAVSGRLELYPRGLSAARALTLARGALLGEATSEAIRQRVSESFPEAEPLPSRPELDQLLSAAGIGLIWDPDHGLYRPADANVTGTGSTRFTRRATTLSGTASSATPTSSMRQDSNGTADIARHGGFFCLVAHPRAVARVRDELTRRFGAQDISLDRMLLQNLRLAAAERNVNWDVVLTADAASRDSLHRQI